MSEIITYNKLVRDKIPEIIKESGGKPTVHIANKREHWRFLKQKLKEEVDEFLKKSNKEELADILELIYAISDFKKLGRKELEKIRKGKEKKRGGFKKRIILDKVRK